LLYDKLHPAHALRISDKGLAVQQQERVEARVAPYHFRILSPADNLIKLPLCTANTRPIGAGNNHYVLEDWSCKHNDCDEIQNQQNNGSPATLATTPAAGEGKHPVAAQW
jgi:hypothetical protein